MGNTGGGHDQTTVPKHAVRVVASHAVLKLLTSFLRSSQVSDATAQLPGKWGVAARCGVGAREG